METYDIRYNEKHRGYLLVSCTYGHPLRSIRTNEGTWAGSKNEADIAFDKIRCRECAADNRHYIGETKI